MRLEEIEKLCDEVQGQCIDVKFIAASRELMPKLLAVAKAARELFVPLLR